LLIYFFHIPVYCHWPREQSKTRPAGMSILRDYLRFWLTAP
jgi:hypothetical protein